MEQKNTSPFSWVIWPSLQEELKPHADFLSGTVLNAGCGSRTLHFPRAEKMIGVDITAGPTVDVVADLEQLPFPDQSFDGIVNIAVLEHCRRPWKVVEEFKRVLKDQGRVICTVPFMQPIHYVPTDFFRFTPDGIRSLFEDQEFEIIKIETTHSLFHTLGWMADEITGVVHPFWKTLVKPAGYLNRWFTRRFTRINVTALPNAITLLAERKVR